MQKKKYARLAAALAALIITGAGWLSAQAATDARGNTYEGEYNTFTANSRTNTVTGNSNTLTGSNNNTIYGDGNTAFYSHKNQIRGNANCLGIEKKTSAGGNDNIIWGDTNTLAYANGNLILGNGNTVKKFSNSWIWGNENTLYEGYSGAGIDSKGTMVIGNGNKVTRHFNKGLLLGNNNTVTGGNSGVLAIGHGMELGAGTDSVVIGNEAKNSGDSSVVIGHDAEGGMGSGNVLIGDGASSTSGGTANNIVIGQNASSTGTESVAIGYGAENHSGYGAAIGAFSKVGSGTYGLAIGGYAEVGDNSQNSIAIGTSGRGYEEGRTRIGKAASRSIAMGANTSVGDNAQQSVAIGGYEATIGENASYSTALGTYSTIADSVQHATALGYHSSINANKGVTLGAYSNIAENSEESIALGYSSSINLNASYSSALGAWANAGAAGSTALGYNSSVETGADNSIAVGRGSKVTADNILSREEVETFLTGLGDAAYQNFNITSGDTNGVFSVGSKGGERRIINVARGRISADSTDAVNGSQLYGAVKYLEGKIENAGGGSGDVSIDGDDNIHVTENEGVTGGGTGTTTPGGSGETGETGGSTVTPGEGGSTGGAGSGSSGSAAGTDGQNFTVNMSDNPVFGGHEADEYGHSADGSVSVVDSTGTAIDINKDKSGGISVVSGGNSVKINEGNSGSITVSDGDHTININADKTGVINGLSNTDWDWSKYEEGGYEGSTNAATESQLHELVGGIEQDITNMGDQITNIGNHVDELDGRINEVGAGAAALAALHPLDFDPDEKWDFAAGYGHYRGENAVAIGAFYRPNEDTMFSLGGTVGNGDEMINAGVSFKLGQGNHVSTSRVAMAKEIIELRKDLEDLRSVMAAGAAGQPLDLSKIQLFPDTPENHWAYDYVATLAGNGLLEGYPDGTFKGDRPVTRYEMAAALYRAMMNGARLSDRALREFAPELDRIRVDTITKDKNGMPEIQRVRVIPGRE